MLKTHPIQSLLDVAFPRIYKSKISLCSSSVTFPDMLWIHDDCKLLFKISSNLLSLEILQGLAQGQKGDALLRGSVVHLYN